MGRRVHLGSRRFTRMRLRDFGFIQVHCLEAVGFILVLVGSLPRA